MTSLTLFILRMYKCRLRYQIIYHTKGGCFFYILLQNLKIQSSEKTGFL